MDSSCYTFKEMLVFARDIFVVASMLSTRVVFV